MCRMPYCDGCSKKIELGFNEEFFFCEDCQKEVLKFLQKKQKKNPNPCPDMIEQSPPCPESTDQ